MRAAARPDVSVIISTYNSPSWLEFVLEGYFLQSFNGSFEIIIADDGSTAETGRLIEALRHRSPVPLIHVWQPDQGFQKCRILNKAIAKSAGELLLLTDGDCVPQPHMVKLHAERARFGSFLTGGYLKLPESLSHLISLEDIKQGRVFKPAWLVSNGLQPSASLLKLMLAAPFDRLANRLTPTKRTWNGHNSSCYRADAIAVNGFNEQMQYGGEDVEFGWRLNFSGIRGRHLRFSTVPVHLFHRHSYVTPEMLDRSKKLRAETRRLRIMRAELGLDQWL
jgi:glycosyltransferase involved in cell wall biosynthesis